MILNCEQQVLTKALNIVSRAVSTRTTIPVLKGILLKAYDNKLYLSASDMDISIEINIDAIVEEEGEQTGDEGCLSYPGKFGQVTRPMRVVVEGLDREMNPVRWEAEGLLARDFCHEIDHLDGHMYMEKVEGEIHDVSEVEENEETVSE